MNCLAWTLRMQHLYFLYFHENISEDKVWTTVVNNLPAQTSVTGSSRERRTVLQLNYSASMEQVTAITTSAEHCQQQVSYACRMSRLLNTPGKTVCSVFLLLLGQNYQSPPLFPVGSSPL
uniref:Uncharacterized protein n=1 Tax=Hucho hucho TaxID=62062 RepID=A0A4W5NQD1_9TELE